MTRMADVVLHIGAPGISSRLISNTLLLRSKLPQDEFLIFSRRKCGTLFKEYLFSRGPKSREAHQDRISAELSSLQTTRGNCIFSYPAILGSPKNLLVSDRGPQMAVARVAALIELLAPRDCVLHLAICSHLRQIKSDPSLQKMEEDRLMGVRAWSSIVRAIKSAQPTCRVIIWDLDSPRVSALAMLVTLLRVTLPNEINKLRELLWIAAEAERRNAPEKVRFSHVLVDYLDWLYEEDLAQISAMQGVTLVSKEEIPIELHLA